MTDDMDHNEEIGLAAEYALGLLSADEAAAFEAVMAVDPDLRDTYADWAEDFVRLTDDIADVPPPAAVEARIRAVLFGDETPEKISIFKRFGLLGPMLGGGIAAAAVLVLLGQTNFLAPQAPQPVGPVLSAQIAAEDQSLIVNAKFDASQNALIMEKTAGGAREGRALELWLIAGDAAPVSLGVWPAGEASVALPVADALVPLIAGGVLAISDEPLGGSTTGAPTGDVLAVGPVTAT